VCPNASLQVQAGLALSASWEHPDVLLAPTLNDRIVRVNLLRDSGYLNTTLPTSASSRSDGSADPFLWLLTSFEPGKARAEIFESVFVSTSDVGKAADVLRVDLELLGMLLNLIRHFVNGGVKRFRGLQQELQPSVDIAGWRVRINTHVFRVNQPLAFSCGNVLIAVLFRGSLGSA